MGCEMCKISCHVLGIRLEATTAEIEAAYRDLTKVWHPDRFGADNERLRRRAEAQMTEINRAYTRLESHTNDPRQPVHEAKIRSHRFCAARASEEAAQCDVITHRVAVGPVRSREIESVGAILDRTAEAAIEEWYGLVLTDCVLMSVPMTCEHRCGHLPQLFHDLVVRLGTSAPIRSNELLSGHAALHGIKRCKSGYTAAMLVEESRLLQVSIFHTLHDNLVNIDFSRLLIGVATIADEVDSQLRQAMESFSAGSGRERWPAWAPVR